MKVSVRHKEAGRQKDNFYQRHCYGCCANASICHCLVLTVVPTTGFTAAASQIYNVGRGTKKRRSGGPLWNTPFTKQPLWREGRIRIIMWSLVTVYQQANRSPAAALSTTDMQTALCLYVHVHGCTLKPFVFIHYTPECSQTALFQ